jgi:ABC-type uncharacterized transport system permease subunit
VIRLGWAVAAAAIGLGVLGVGLELGGYDAAAALGSLWAGAFGSWYAFTSATLVRSVPLILIGLGIAIAFRGGAFNIGAEGQFYAGAIAATWVALHLAGVSSLLSIPLVLGAATLAGAIWVAIPVWLKLRFGVIEVISTLLLWYLFNRTLWGFQLRAVGLGPRAAEVSGRIDSARMGAIALFCSGALAGLSGGIEISGVSYALFQNLSPGYGFTGIAVALLGGLHPIGVLFSGVFLGALEAGAGAMQRDAGVPSVAVYVVEAVIIVVALLATTPKGGWMKGRVIRRIRPATSKGT